jgi:formylglycine-generating enzyme required for sulfatase activity
VPAASSISAAQWDERLSAIENPLAKTGILAGMTRMALAAVATVFVVVAPVSRRSDPMTGMQFVLVPAGSFEMGTPASEAGREAQEQRHPVTVSRPFYLAIHEVTQAQWQKVMGSNPSNFTGCARCPVERVTYHDVEELLRRLDRLSGWPGFRLPTEAEWEYACRAGGSAAYGSSPTIDSRRANIDGTRTRRVGAFAPNAWGLFDMSGNVWEWTSDDHCEYPAGAVTDPAGRCGSGLKVIRGGSWKFAADSARCGLRYTHRPQDRGYSLGVRLAHDTQ